MSYQHASIPTTSAVLIEAKPFMPHDDGDSWNAALDKAAKAGWIEAGNLTQWKGR